ncbi:hypothetical protein D9757_007215 [Collybiopsis confluens]|uniref:Replication factor A protein 3 n=1 Tax=Collybiopsis confluens TaxID=2823264 RepID=A0A8H5M417_9AGAR|nr:hypothetical protein D9757_007215 [Collybiopsis confluens]
MSDENTSPRVNSAFLPKFVGRMVRVPCKVLTTTDTAVTVQSTDGGEISITFAGDSGITSTFVEIIGKVVDEQTVKKFAVINHKVDLDMQSMDGLIRLWHDPRFFDTVFS